MGDLLPNCLRRKLLFAPAHWIADLDSVSSAARSDAAQILGGLIE